MGKKNRLKQLLGRFNVDTNCELRVLPYSLGDAVCEMLLKVDLNHANSLAIANVPYYLDKDTLKQLFSSLGIDVVEVNLTASTSLHGNLRRGYCSGRLVFPTIHARRRAFDSINHSMCPFKLENFGVNLPAWHKPVTNRYGKRKRVVREAGGMEVPGDTEAQTTEIDSNNQIDEDGWITVTRKHKFSFRNKVNRSDEGNATFMGMEGSADEPYDCPRKKKRNR
ncbi:hypothetical protein niasHT_024173 [Heterodera trifolii]|uniref:RRM domain-containing protein n=1 Tax=Heterodera trifolii TaxID=157864 RepID=A0ABD2JLV8_9BILA